MGSRSVTISGTLILCGGSYQSLADEIKKGGAKMSFVSGLIVGLLIGGSVGVLICAVMVGGGKGDGG